MCKPTINSTSTSVLSFFVDRPDVSPLAGSIEAFPYSQGVEDLPLDFTSRISKRRIPAPSTPNTITTVVIPLLEDVRKVLQFG